MISPSQLARGNKDKSHGPRCECMACSSLMNTARRIVERDPHVKTMDMESAIRDFVYFAKYGRHNPVIDAECEEGAAQ